MNSLNQQAHLANFAPQKNLEQYSKGADPRVISGIVALSEMQQQAAERQRASLANGAAQGQMPTVRDKIMQMFQQSNQQQPQQQPNPMVQRGIMAQAHPQMQTAPMPEGEAPQEAQMYHGGVAHLPVNDRMFGYANGGIIAFRTGERPEDKEGYTGGDEKLTPEQVREILDRITTEGRAPSAPPSQRPSQPESPESPEAFLARRGEQLRGAPREPISQEARPMFPFATAGRNIPRGGVNELVDQPVERVGAEPAPKAAPAPRPVVGVSEDEAARARAQAAAVDPRRVGIAAGTNQAPARPAPPTTNAAPPSAGPGGPTPPTKPTAPATGTGIDQLLQQQQTRLTAQANAPKMPEPNVTEGGLKYLAAQDKYVRETGDSEAAKRLYKVYDDMAKRARADDDAQAAQRAEDARNNLWSFLSNTRGSSLGVAAGKADAALQPLLAEQKKANAEYRKYSYERDMNRNKADAEARMAEEARKRGEFGKAIEHEQKERAYLLEVRKADQLAEHNKNVEINQALQTQATLQASREGHITQLEVAKINKAAQMAGYNKPSEAERVRAEYQRILEKSGQKAADAFLADEQKIRAVVGGVKYEGQEKDQTRAYYQSLYQDPNYGPAEDKIRRLEAKLKRTEKDEQALAAARAYVKRKQEEVRRDFGMAGGAGDTGGARVISEADIQATMRSSGQSREAVIAAAKARGYTIQ